MIMDILTYLDKHCDPENKTERKQENIIQEAVDLLQVIEGDIKVEFIVEQLQLSITHPNRRRYRPSLQAMAVLWQNVSTAGYRQILQDGVLTLPSERHLRRLTSSLNVDLELTETAISYLKARKSKLEAKDILVNIVMDEVYCQQNVQYCNGKFYGLENDKATKTILGVMIKSVAGSYRDMMCLSPTYNLNAKKLEKVWQNVVRVVSDIGFDVVLTMTDGHPSNLTFFNNIVSDTG